MPVCVTLRRTTLFPYMDISRLLMKEANLLLSGYICVLLTTLSTSVGNIGAQGWVIYLRCGAGGGVIAGKTLKYTNRCRLITMPWVGKTVGTCVENDDDQRNPHSPKLTNIKSCTW